MKKYVLTLVLFLGIVLGSLAQSGWQTGEIYQHRGQTWTEWRWQTIGYNNWGQPINVRFCRNTTWHQKYYEGYVFVWHNGAWRTVWKRGYYWYCTWSGWYRC